MQINDVTGSKQRFLQRDHRHYRGVRREFARQVAEQSKVPVTLVR
jgi:hypothetical protein